MENRKINDEVLYPKDKFVSLKAADLQFLKTEALKNPRQRIRLCAHANLDDKVHEMFIVHGADAYVRPHRHLNKTESLFLVEGEADAIFFNDAGDVVQRIAMGPMGSGKQFYYRLCEPLYHSLFIKSDAISFFEVTSGPFNPDDTQFPSWAPDGKDETKARQYMNALGRGVSCA